MIQPLRGKILVKVIPEHKKTETGLYLSENIKDIPKRGEVIAVGDYAIDKKGKTLKWDFRIGDIVYFKRKWDQKADNYILLRDDIICVETSEGIHAPRDLVIIKRVYTGKIGNSSVVIPDGLGIKSNYEDYYGEVISEGPESKFNLNKGDKILYHRNEGQSFKYDYKEYWSLKPRAVLAMAEV